MKQLTEPYSIDGTPVYIGFLKSRALEWIIHKKIFSGMEIKRLVINGTNKIIAKRTPIIIDLKKSKMSFKIFKEEKSMIKFDMFPVGNNSSVTRGKGNWGKYYLNSEKGKIDLEEIYEILMKYNPETLYIKEIEAWIPNYKLRLIFRDKFTTDENIRKVISKEKDTRANPLFLQYLYDEKTIRMLRKQFFHKNFPIAKAELDSEKIVKFSIVENGA